MDNTILIKLYIILDGSNASVHGHKKWDDARNFCNNLNTSLPGLNSTFITTERARIINSTICLAVVQTSSIVFQPVIKQITKKTIKYFASELFSLDSVAANRSKTGMRKCNNKVISCFSKDKGKQRAWIKAENQGE